jgi:hypothetical protein
LPSPLLHPLPCLRPTFAIRTSGYCLSSFRSVNFLHTPFVNISQTQRTKQERLFVPDLTKYVFHLRHKGDLSSQNKFSAFTLQQSTHCLTPRPPLLSLQNINS